MARAHHEVDRDWDEPSEYRQEQSRREREHSSTRSDYESRVHGTDYDYEDASPEEIEADIRRTRAEMDQTIHALSDRLHPRQIIESLFSMFRNRSSKKAKAHDGREDGAGEKAKAIGKYVLKYVQNHPVPSVLMTTALTTLIYETATQRSGRKVVHHVYEPEQYSGSYVDARTGRPYPESSSSRGYQGERGAQHEEPGMMQRGSERAREWGSKTSEQAREMKERAGERLSQAGHSMREGAERAGESIRSGSQRIGEGMSQAGHRVSEGMSHAGHRISEGVSHTGERIRESAQSMKSQLQTGMEKGREMIEERPIAVGTCALALGLIAGLLIPRTRQEHRFMGEQAEDVLQHGKEMGQEMFERTKDAASEVIGAATEEAKHQGEELKEAAEKGVDERKHD